MRHVACRVVFETDAGQVTRFVERARETFRRRAVPLRRGKPLCGFENVGAAAEAARREARRSDTGRGRVARVQRLAHRAELRLQARGLRAGDAERARRRLGIETHQIRRGGRGAEAAERAGRVPALRVVRTAEIAADDAFGIDAGRKRREQRRRPFVEMFSEREHGRRDRYGGVTVHRHMHIVVVVCVPGSAVDQCGLLDVDALAATDHARLRATAQIGRFGIENVGERFACAGKGHADEIEQALLRHGLRRGEAACPTAWR